MSCAHETYEMLCAFAAVGQLSEGEANDLREHVDSCPSCHRRLLEMERASFEYFRRHAGDIQKVRTPAGMRRRFEERAASMGVPLRGTTSRLSGTRLLGAALSVLLLTALAQLSWQVLYPRMLERAAMHQQTTEIKHTQLAPEAFASAISDPVLQKISKGPVRRKRSITRLRNPDSYNAQRETSRDDTYPMLYQSWSPQRGDAEACVDTPSPSSPEVGRGYVTLGLSLPVRRTFQTTSGLGLWTDGGYTIPRKHPFRYNPSLASLSFLRSPERAEVPRFPAMHEPPPLFRTTNPRTW